MHLNNLKVWKGCFNSDKKNLRWKMLFYLLLFALKAFFFFFFFL